jgi:lysophospholipase L1-like esterase
MYRVLPRSVAITILLLLAACSSSPPPISLQPIPYDATIVAFGDSLTSGPGLKPGQKYPALLERQLGRKVINAGRRGEDSSQGLRRLPRILEKYRPALLILIHGGNDVLRNTGKRRARENLRRMIALAQKRKIDVILVGIPERKLMLPTSEIYYQLGKEFRIPVEGSVIAQIIRDPELRLDRVHPNEKGHRLIAKAIMQILTRYHAI